MSRNRLNFFHQQPNSLNFLSKHLPEKLFQYLTERNLLNCAGKKFLHMNDFNVTATVSVSCVPRSKNNPHSYALITIATEKEHGSYVCKHYFRNKHWVNEDIVTSTKKTHSFGLSKFSQDEMLTEKEWQLISPNKINAVLLQIGFLMKEIKEEPPKMIKLV